MKNLVFFLIVSLAIVGCYSCFSQGFQEPGDGKAVVYFVRTSSAGALNPFHFFNQDKYIGSVRKLNYMRYECDPGEQLFWTKNKTKQAFFLTADLREGGTYLVNVTVSTSKRKILVPVTYNDEKEFKKASKKIATKEPIITPEHVIQEMNAELEDYIPERLELYNSHLKHEIDYQHISADMAIPQEALK